jgi:ubiquinone/menaquinone biosynthesis C-methylase UbiE
MNKQAYYQAQDTVATYEQRRFGGVMGQWVDQRERGAVRALANNQAASILDCPCGTGRMLTLFQEGAAIVVGADTSYAMLGASAQRLAQHGQYPVRLVQGSIYALPFQPAAFDLVLCMRFAVHCADLGAVLEQLKGKLSPGGVLIFDTQRRSLRASSLPGLRAVLGGRLYVHTDAAVQHLLQVLGLSLVEKRAVFLFSTLVYRYLPAWSRGLWEWLEKRLPEAWRHKVYWKVKRAAGGTPEGRV